MNKQSILLYFFSMMLILYTGCAISFTIKVPTLNDFKREVTTCFSGGCDVAWKINQRIDQGIESKAQAAGKGVNKEMQKAADYIFDVKLAPFANTLQKMVNSEVVSAEEAASRLLDHVDIVLNTIVDNAQKSSEEIIELTFSKVNILQEDVFRNIKISWEKIAKDTDCIALKREKYVDSIRDLLKDAFIFFPTRTACHDKHGISVKDKSDYTDSEVFLLWQCGLTSKHTINTPAATMASHYGDIQQKASQMMCYSSLAGDAPSARSIYLMYWVESGKRADIWRRAGGIIIN